MKLTFIGATTTVTGSKTLLEVEGHTFLIDAGLYQEDIKLSPLNYEALPFDVKKLSAVIITHAHLDHSGYLPYLYKCGYRGPIYLTKATSKLARIIIEDSAELMSENKKPFYTKEDAISTTSLFKPKLFKEPINHGPISFKFHHAGHILGASYVEIVHKDESLVFSGDLGRYDDPLIGPPDSLVPCQNLVMEATYGNRNRVAENMTKELTAVLKETVNSGKTLLIPCFALHRAQLLSHLFQQIFLAHPDLKIPMAFNSPMMKDVTKVYLQYTSAFTPEEAELKEEWSRMHFLDHFWDIEAVNTQTGAKIIIASSGMMTGGRIWTHLKDLAEREDTILFLPGYQAPGTPGHEVANGARSIYTPEGLSLSIRAKVITSDAFSSHGDQEDLLRWVHSCPQPPKKIFLIHGEEKSKIELAEILTQKGYSVVTPGKIEEIML